MVGDEQRDEVKTLFCKVCYFYCKRNINEDMIIGHTVFMFLLIALLRGELVFCPVDNTTQYICFLPLQVCEV